ncbi:MAG: hypothetical protein ACHQQR_08360 [Gemmatimonadales bacterium]
MRHRSILLAACALTVATLAPSHARAQTPIRFSGAAALALPIGDLGDAADVGFNLALRGEGRLPARNWSLRGDLSWDRFSGKGIIDSYSYYGLAGNLVHRNPTGRLYEFGGLGLYGNTTTFANQLNRSDTNLGVQMGLGLDLAPGPHTPFVEFGLTSVFTSGNNSLWFPVRFGVRF